MAFANAPLNASYHDWKDKVAPLLFKKQCVIWGTWKILYWLWTSRGLYIVSQRETKESNEGPTGQLAGAFPASAVTAHAACQPHSRLETVIIFSWIEKM